MYRKILTPEEVKEKLSEFSRDTTKNLYIFYVSGPGDTQILAKKVSWLSYRELVEALSDNETTFLEIKEEQE